MEIKGTNVDSRLTVKLRDGRQILDPFDSAYLISGYCNISFLGELQRFILRHSPCVIAVSQSFTPPAKDFRCGSVGSHFTFLMDREPTDKQIAYLKSITDGYAEDLTLEKFRIEEDS